MFLDGNIFLDRVVVVAPSEIDLFPQLEHVGEDDFIFDQWESEFSPSVDLLLAWDMAAQARPVDVVLSGLVDLFAGEQVEVIG